MAKPALATILQQLEALSTEELQQVERILRQQLVDRESALKRYRFYQSLQATGLVRQIKTYPVASREQRQRLATSDELASARLMAE